MHKILVTQLKQYELITSKSSGHGTKMLRLVVFIPSMPR